MYFTPTWEEHCKIAVTLPTSHKPICTARTGGGESYAKCVGKLQVHDDYGQNAMV
jgi:hypothetical protein